MATFGPIAAALVAEGCSAEQIAAAVTALEAAREREREARLDRLREGARLRQQRLRERRRGRMEQSADESPSRMSRRDSALPPSPKESFPQTPFKEITPTPGESAPAREAGEPDGEPIAERGDRLEARRGRAAGAIPRGCRMPANFAASAEDLAFGAAEGLSPAEIGRTLEDMRLWAAEAAGEKALRADWHATFRRFLRRDGEAKRLGRRGPPALAIWRPPPASTGASAPTVHVRRDSPQGKAWWAFVKARTGKTPPLDRAGGWRFPSKWPPWDDGSIRTRAGEGQDD